ncbi:MAG: hypothetical protein NC201_03080 [Prevotella sp.]|nr:hypothetical protein [Bacteroides sp.]MCM1366210.1 hypothetical protein [Prevotella sp.]MCM1436962.1 hypothetical protein [Prevotella sp.]
MKKIILALALVLSAIIAQAQQSIPVSMMPMLVNEIKSSLPSQLDDETTWTDCSMIKGGNEMQLTLRYDLSGVNFSADDMINQLKGMSEDEISNFMGQDMASVFEIIPVPISLKILFSDGKEYVMKIKK